MDQLEFSPFNVGDNIVNGVVEVTIPKATYGKDIFSLTNTMYQATVDRVGNSLVAASHIMYCVPYGTEFDGSKNWVAFANMHGKSSYYNNKWCDRLSAQMHEIGHNLGLQHSTENGGEYGDEVSVYWLERSITSLTNEATVSRVKRNVSFFDATWHMFDSSNQ